MVRMIGDRRKSPRFDIRLPLRYRLSQRGVENRWNTGITRDMSKDGVVFKTRHPLPVGGHLEVRIDWPARYRSVHPVDLHLTGFIVRSGNGRAAVHISSHRFLVQEAQEAELYKTA
jgi:PilZ domain